MGDLVIKSDIPVYADAVVMLEWLRLRCLSIFQSSTAANEAVQTSISLSIHTVQRAPSERDFGNRPSLILW
jgi:hypothetical protein